jgi:hypothetical protein
MLPVSKVLEWVGFPPVTRRFWVRRQTSGDVRDRVEILVERTSRFTDGEDYRRVHLTASQARSIAGDGAAISQALVMLDRR